MGEDLSAPQPSETGYGELSLWLDAVAETLRPRPSLLGRVECDVAIVGAGFTGLWTALYLRRLRPSLDIVILDGEIAGFGASGRNGGWCSNLFPTSLPALARRYDVAAARALLDALEDAVDEVGRAAAEEGIDCHFHKGGSFIGLRNPAQLARAAAELAAARGAGTDETALRMLDADAAKAICRMDGLLGGLFTPHCAALQPALLTRGLAAAVERGGTTIYERSPAISLADGTVRTRAGTVRAGVVVRATEAYTCRLPGARRLLAPVYSLMIATEPLADAAFEAIGLADRQTFADHRHLTIYGQRTADNRIAFGGRGAPYRYGSAIAGRFDQDPGVHAGLASALVELFPALEGVRITHRWGGPLGVPRDWQPSVGYDREQRLAWAGGYVGDGVAASNLAGRTLAELIAGEPGALGSLCWVGHRSPRWEPEPARYAGINLARLVMASADRVEERTSRPAWRAALLGRLLGH